MMLLVQGEVDELLERLPREHREAVARVITIASQGSLCAPFSPRFPPPPPPQTCPLTWSLQTCRC